MAVHQIFLPDEVRLVIAQRFWNNELVFPAYLALALLLVQTLTSFVHLEQIQVFFRLRMTAIDTSAHATPATQSRGFLLATKEQIQTQGSMVMLFRALNVLGISTLVGLTIAAFLIFDNDDEGFVTKIETVHLALYSYTLLLALIALVPSRRWSSAARTHMTLIMLAVVAVYLYRDIYPLATFTLMPQDRAQGWLLWSRIGVASLVGFFIPLFTPRVYEPVDPLNPAKEVASEQTASWWSLLTYSFMDPVIWMAARTSHLPYESLPPLADYDQAEYLVTKSEQVLDPFLRRKRTHLLWGLGRFFAWECAQLIAMIVLKCLTNMMAPYALNMLLTYLENEGEATIVRPWVWVLWLFLGPFIGTLAIQYYGFISTRTLVRAEGILTQLVFDHALRIRMKSEADTNSAETTVANSPEMESVAEGRSDGEEGGTSPESGEEALHGGAGSYTVPSSSSSKAVKEIGKSSTSQTSVISAVMSRPNAEKSAANPKSANLIGKLNNFVTTDLNNITDGREIWFTCLLGPLQFIICIWFLYELLSWSAILGMAITLISIPLPSYFARVLNKVQTERMEKTDARVQTVTEILSVIRMTKLFGWENKVAEQISEKRETELALIKKGQLLGLLNNLITFFFPILTMLATFASYTLLQKQDLTAAKVFSSMAVFVLMRQGVEIVFFGLPSLINAQVSLGRINDFLLDTELLDRFTRKGDEEGPEVDPSQNIESKAIGFRDATFSWTGIMKEDNLTSSKRRFRLKIEGDLFFQPGRINLIIGPTGCGKTSLLMALLGEMHYEPNSDTAGFNLPRGSGVAYAAQEAWVQSETVKENILFGKPYDKERYDKVIFQCGLERDLSLFEAGDETEVGERGLTLSGGQRMRLTLARAVYSNAEILLLDDILAALDVHTAKFIVENCFQKDLLKGRTTILVTHNVAMLTPVANFIVSLGPDGRIISQGTVSDALAKDHMLLEEVTPMDDIVENAEEIIGTREMEEKDGQGKAKLVMAEEIALGHVGWPAFKLYISGVGGPFFWITFLGGLFLSEAITSLATWFLGYWASQYQERPGWAVPVAYYLSIYIVILFAVIVAYSVAKAIFVVGSIKASRTIHRKLIKSVLGTTLRWLDTVPTARIIARCTQDIRAVDGLIGHSLSILLELSISMLVHLASIVLFVPIFVLPSILVFIIGGLCGQLFIKAQLSVKRETSNSRSPVLDHFGVAITGLISLRAYSAEAAFKRESLKRINGYTRPARTLWNCNRWIAIRIDTLGGLFAAGLAAYFVYGKGLHTASITGFSLTMAIAFSGEILWWVRFMNQFEIQSNSLERIEDYVTIEQEPKATSTGKPPAYWPASGAITVENLRARYSTGGPEVLRDISFEIKSGERVGVVGRTGSGKSSLTLSLLRCIPTEGRVIFDGLDTDSINLDALRSSITIIPQQPELLRGTLRENLDPFSEHSDATLNDALRAAGLFNLQEENDTSKITLDSSVSSAGSNLSVGQRQILALARAIVRRSKLLILDEATSAIDYATDTIIQNTLREVLNDATLITVAHRLQSIMDADKIMVLDAGNMVEFGSPAALLKNRDGYLRSLVDESGDRDALFKMAEKAEKSTSEN